MLRLSIYREFYEIAKKGSFEVDTYHPHSLHYGGVAEEEEGGFQLFFIIREVFFMFLSLNVVSLIKYNESGGKEKNTSIKLA